MWYRSYVAAGFFFGEGVREGVLPVLEVERDRRCRFAGFLNAGNVDFSCDGGSTRTPSVGAEFQRDTSRATAVVEQDLHDCSARRVADEDGGESSRR